MSKPTHHTQNASQTQALEPWAAEPWQEIVALLPAECSQQARTLGAFTRARGLRDPLDLLRGILAYVFCLSSFRQVGGWARSLHLSENGARSWAKRTRQAAWWLLWIVEALLQPAMDSQREALAVPAAFAGRVHLVDATCLRTWKRNGESRRLHCSYDLLGQRLEQVTLTDQHGSEGLRHFQFQPGDVVVGDSAYCRRQGLFDQMEAGVHVLVRLHWANTPLLQQDGSSFDLGAWLSHIREQGAGEVEVLMGLRERRVRMRLIAVRMSEEAAARAHRRRREHARKHGRTNRALTIQIAEWLVVLTSLPAAQWSSDQVLLLYRARWQIELLFKRIKQLVRLHRLRSSQMQSNQAVLAALLIGWILLEQQAVRLRQELASHTSESSAGPRSNWALCALLVQSMRTMLLGTWTWSQLRASLVREQEAILHHRQQRTHQESLVLEYLPKLLSQGCPPCALA
jgi:hypothetical protein